MGRRARYWGDSGKRSSNATLLGVGPADGDMAGLDGAREPRGPSEYAAGGVPIRLSLECASKAAIVLLQDGRGRLRRGGASGVVKPAVGGWRRGGRSEAGEWQCRREQERLSMGLRWGFRSRRARRAREWIGRAGLRRSSSQAGGRAGRTSVGQDISTCAGTAVSIERQMDGDAPAEASDGRTGRAMELYSAPGGRGRLGGWRAVPSDPEPARDAGWTKRPSSSIAALDERRGTHRWPRWMSWCRLPGHLAWRAVGMGVRRACDGEASGSAGRPQRAEGNGRRRKGMDTHQKPRRSDARGPCWAMLLLLVVGGDALERAILVWVEWRRREVGRRCQSVSQSVRQAGRLSVAALLRSP